MADPRGPGTPLQHSRVEDLVEEVRMHDIDTTKLELEEPAQSAAYAEFGEAASPFGEMQEIELASELLEIGSEFELEQFLGNVLNAVGGAARQFASSPTGQALGGILKDAARQALPVVGQAVGQWVSPSGGAVGAQLATQDSARRTANSKSPASLRASPARLARRHARRRRRCRRTTRLAQQPSARLRPLRQACCITCAGVRGSSGRAAATGSARGGPSFCTPETHSRLE